jgi:hypothetical protein
MTHSELIIAAALTAMAPAAAAGSMAIACPAQLPAEAVQVVRPASGWTGFVPSFFLLHSVGVTVGRLQERATLRGEYQQLARKAYRVSFPLDDSKGEKWLMCEYAHGQLVQAQRLPDDTNRCDVLHTPDKHGGFAIQTTCVVGTGVPAGRSGS